MTNQEINERVAKLCGWEHIKSDSNPNLMYWAKFNGMAYSGSVANYAESLDACREFMETLSKEERYEYGNWIMNIKRFDTLYGGNRITALITVTALERCEAFLRMKGQWE